MPERLITFFGKVKNEFSEWQKEGKLKDFAYLFSIDVEFNEVLNNGIITEELNNIFKTKGFQISENVMVTKDKGDSWVITDGEKKYVVEKEYGKLNIYDSAKPVAKGSAEIALEDRPPSVLRGIIKNVIDKSFPDEEEELLKELKEFSENQFEEVSSKIDVSVENLRVIRKETLSTLEEIPSEVKETKSEVKETKSEVKETKGRYSEFIIVDKNVKPALGVEVIAAELSKLLINMENQSGMMVGIFGKWGRGKTFLMDQIWAKLKSQHKPLFCKVNFQAWKYQDTPASWAYLYEEFAKKYYGKPKNTFSLSWFTYWKKILLLNFKRKGWLPLISVLVGILTSLLLVSLFDYLQSENMLGGNTAIIGISVTLFGSFVGIWKYLKKEYGFKAIELFKDYSEKQTFKQFLGIQAEIQEELKILLEAWIPKKKSKAPKILLFVDDIDRCSEERIIQIIDSLRVMLEADGIYQRIIVISAMDENVLKRALKWKYSFFFNDDKENNKKSENNDQKENNKKSEKLDDLFKEYMDKLFLIGIKLGQLTDDEKEEIFKIYTISRDIVAPIPQDSPVKKETTSETDSGEVTSTKLVARDEPKAELNEEEQRGDNLEVRKEENKYELSHEEYEFLLEYINLLEEATPRKVRIFYYRYLLARNLLERLRSTGLERIWSQETYKLAIPRLILNESNPTKLFSFNENSRNSTSDKINMNIDQNILDELTKIIKMVVAY